MLKRFKNVLIVIFIFLILLSISSCKKTEDDTKNKQYTISFYVDDKLYHTIKSSGNELITMPQNPNKDGYVFIGWYFDKDVWATSFSTDSLVDIELDNDLTIYALFKEDPFGYTYNETAYYLLPNWSVYEVPNSNIFTYTNDKLFKFDYKYDENGEIIKGDYVVEYSAATKIEDVSNKYVGDEYEILPDETGRAYKITLRNDLRWDDGSSITAHDFVYSMKEQLNPLFNYHTSKYYISGNNAIYNAYEYYTQKPKLIDKADNYYSTYIPSEQDDHIYFHLSTIENGSYYSSFRDILGFSEYDSTFKIVRYFNNTCYIKLDQDVIVEMEGKTMKEIKENPIYKEELDKLISWWKTEYGDELDFFIVKIETPGISFDNVGYFVGDNAYELVIIFEKPVHLLREDGSLSYLAAYTGSGGFPLLPLVKKDLYESCKVSPVEGIGYWDSTYCSNLETSASWGPYKLVEFEKDNYYKLVKNPNWYGFNLPENINKYQTTTIICRKYNGNLLKEYLNGNLDIYSIDSISSSDNVNGEKAYYVPNDAILSLYLQSDVNALKSREEDGINKTILAYPEFRQALALSIDRNKFINTTSKIDFATYGIFNTQHYSDINNGLVYRYNDRAKQALCEIYNVNISEFNSLDEAYSSITGYDLTYAKQLVEIAYQKAKQDGRIKDTDKVMLTYANEMSSRIDFFENSWNELVKGTSLEGRLAFYNCDRNQDAILFNQGYIDMCLATWTGSTWDLGNLLQAYLSKDYMYSYGWDTKSHQMTFTMPGALENGEDITDTLSLIEWYNCLNSIENAKYLWGKNDLEESKRVLLIAALEKEILKTYYTIPISYECSGHLISEKINYVTSDYNVFMNFGGIEYITYNYNNIQWDLYTKSKNKN